MVTISTKRCPMAKRYHNSNGKKKSGKKMSGKYHQTISDRYHEMEGMYRYEDRKYGNSSMIHEDRSQMANLPRDYYIKEYPKTRYYGSSYLSDDINGIDNQMDRDSRMITRDKYPEKF